MDANRSFTIFRGGMSRLVYAIFQPLPSSSFLDSELSLLPLFYEPLDQDQ